MDLINVGQNELYSILQKTSLVNIKFPGIDNYISVAVLFCNENSLDIFIDLKKSRYIIEYGENVEIKFQREGYEFLLEGEIREVTVAQQPPTASIKLLKCKKILNKRRFIRYDTDEIGIVKSPKVGDFTCKILNLSLGGAMIRCSTNISVDEQIILKAKFFDIDEIELPAKLVRSISSESGEYSFGLEFVKMDSRSETILRKILLTLEKKYLMNIGKIKNIKANVNAPVVLFNVCTFEGFEVKETLGDLGILDYFVFHDFRVYADFFMEEKPKLVIIEADEVSQQLKSDINTLLTNINNISIVLIMPMQNVDDETINYFKQNNVELVFKPFISDELKNIIIKQL